MKNRLLVSLSAAFGVAILLFIVTVIFLMVVREQRVQDLASHSSHIAQMVGENSSIRTYIQDQPQAPTLETVEEELLNLIQGDPFIEELSIFDPFGKMQTRVARTREEPSPNPVRRASPSLHEILTTGQPTLEESGEYFIPLDYQNDRWGVLRVRWQPEATEMYFNRLKNGAYYMVIGFFVFVALFVFWLLRITYEKEHMRMAAELRIASSGNSNYQLEPQSYSSIMAEISAYINRLQRGHEEARSKSHVLDDALRQAERGCADSRKSLEIHSQSMESMRKEMREGLNTILELSWSAVLIIDHNFRLHYINPSAERLLRLVQRDKEVIDDERLRRCLSPLITQSKAERIDDLCAWPQPGLGRSLSCRIRAAQLPVVDSLKLFIVLLREESGYPSALDSSYFSERVLRDLISPRGTRLPWIDSRDAPLDADVERRFKTCLQRIVFFHDLERRKVEPMVSVRFSRWLRERFLAEDLFSEHLNLNVHAADADISLCIPEKSTAELIDCLIILIGQLADYDKHSENKPIDMYASSDSQGQPVLTLSIICGSRKRAQWMQDVLDEQCDLLQESALDDYTLDRLERDVCYCIYRCAKDILRVKVETVYSENKHIASIHVLFPRIQGQPRVEVDSTTGTAESVDQLMRTYFRPS
ncbi:MAG: hypothetical protein P9L94_01360 [Candidatus Hinthialibacter antarcticus]|nr:hypothetical protein [Candidatus Hinthialibacter antarcticus]